MCGMGSIRVRLRWREAGRLHQFRLFHVQNDYKQRFFHKNAYSDLGRPHRFDYFSAETITNRRFSKKTITGSKRPTRSTRPTPRTNP
jgi:hypothetical protein